MGKPGKPGNMGKLSKPGNMGKLSKLSKPGKLSKPSKLSKPGKLRQGAFWGFQFVLSCFFSFEPFRGVRGGPIREERDRRGFAA